VKKNAKESIFVGTNVKDSAQKFALIVMRHAKHIVVIVFVNRNATKSAKSVLSLA
jgi:hypothetical protein